MSDTINEMINSYKPLIKKLAKKWKKEPRVSEDDLTSEGMEAVYKALLSYDENKGGGMAALSSYIYNCVNNAMQSFFQANCFQLHSTAYLQKKDLETIKQQERTIVNIDMPLGKASSTYPGGQLYLKDIIPSGFTNPQDSAIIKEECKFLNLEINKLNKRDRYIINEYKDWFGDKTLQEIGDNLGVSKQYVANQIKRIKDKLKKNLEVLCED